MPADGHALLHPAERGYVILTPVQAMNQEVAEGDSLQLQVHIEAYPKLLHWHWEHMNSLKNPGSNKLKSEMVPKNNWCVFSLFYAGRGLFQKMFSV